LFRPNYTRRARSLYKYKYIKLRFIGFINVLISSEYKTCQKYIIYRKTITAKTQRQQGKIQFTYTALISSDIHTIVIHINMSSTIVGVKYN
jgi:hypothetical protein